MKKTIITTEIGNNWSSRVIGWTSPETPASWPTKRRKFSSIFWFAVMMAFVAAVLIRIAIGPDEEQPKFSPALSIEERAPEGYFKVDGGYIHEN